MRSVIAVAILAALPASGQLYVKPFVGSGVTIGAGGGGTSCADGVDCYCDTVSDPKLIWCQDFEKNTLYATTNWVAGGTSRGITSDYIIDINDGAGPAGGWFTNGTPVSPQVGSTCVAPGQVCGYKEWCSDAQSALVLGYAGSDCWDGNSGALIDIQRSGDFDEEISGLTLTGGKGASPDIGAGRQHLAYRVPPGNEGSIIGGKNWGPTLGKKLEIGITEAVAFSSNMLASGLINGIQKGDEWGDYPFSEWWVYGNATDAGGGASAFPFKNFFWTTTSQANCQAAQAAATMLVGQFSGCTGNAMYYRATVGTGAGQYTQSVHWPFGTWACIQGHAKWTGAAGSRKLEVEVKLNGTTVIHFTDFDAEILRSNQGYDEMYFNMYSNTNATGQGGTPSVETGYRYKDNLHITAGPPVSCASIGY